MLQHNVSGYGITVTLVASVTFPQGLTITQFADDSDPFDSASTAIAEAASGVNGDLVVWSKAAPIPATLSLISGSEDDYNLAALYEANRPSASKAPAGDVITMTVIYPDGSSETASEGAILSGPPMRSVASSGKQKARQYAFAFADRVQSATE